MRHHSKIKKFGRERNQRHALIRSLAVSLVRDGKIKSTEQKAKALRPFIERLVTNGKKKTLAARRGIANEIGDKSAGLIVKTISPKYSDRNGGYTRVTKLVRRASDGAKQAIIEFV
ncbi:MAG: 50S ribosomal protein L17 [Patescibacteria group bacterium]